MIADGWNGFNILHTAAGRVGALDVCALPAQDGFVWLAETVWAPVHRACARAREAAKATAAAAKGGAR